MLRSRVSSIPSKHGQSTRFVKCFVDIYPNIFLLQGGYTMFIVFDQVVDVSRSQLVVDGFTFVNRLGGTIGFCKELLWIVLMFGTAFTLGKKFLKMIL